MKNIPIILQQRNITIKFKNSTNELNELQNDFDKSRETVVAQGKSIGMKLTAKQ